MSEFITGNDLENVIYDIIWKAEETLMIVSPFIKLDDYFKEIFDNHQSNPNIHLLIVFGKNEKAVKKSMSKKDFDYFKKFLNVSIIYVPNLHAKYYGNENEGVITSINLYDYSFKNNIEFGVYHKSKITDIIKQSADKAAWDECHKIAEENEVVFIKRPVYHTKKFIVSLGKNYVKSDVVFDSTEKFYGYKNDKLNDSSKRLSDFPEILELGSNKGERPERVRKIEEKVVKKKAKENIGYCIRTGKEIPYNLNKPMNKESWQVWNQYGDYDFGEAYCHKTGKQSYGKTSMRNPVLGYDG